MAAPTDTPGVSSESGILPTLLGTGPGGIPNYADLQRRRAVAVALASRGRPFPKTTGEGLTYLGEALGERFANQGLGEQERRYAAADTLSPPTGAVASPVAVPPTVAPPRPVAPRPVAEIAPDPKDLVARAIMAQQGIVGPSTPQVASGVASSDPTEAGVQPPPASTIASASETASPAGSGTDDSIWASRQDAIGRIESGGKKDPYTAVGNQTKYGPGLGRYQVVAANVAPWTQAALGQALTPQQFLASPEAQDAVFKHRFGQYVDQFGEEGAARAWFGGPGNVAKGDLTDVNKKLSIADYGKTYLSNLEGAAPTMMAYAPSGATATDAPAPGAGRMVIPPLTEENPVTPSDISPAPVRVAGGAVPGMVPLTPGGSVPGAAPAGVVPSTTMPTATVNPFPDPGAEPRPPPPTPTMEYYRKASEENWRSPETRAEARRLYEDQQRIQREDFARTWQLWKENRQKRQEYELKLPEIEATRTEQQLRLKNAQEAETLKATYGNLPAPIATHLDDSTKNAKAASGSLEALNDARVAMDAGTLFGAGADAKLLYYRARALAGDKDADRIVAATETYKTNLGPIIQATVRGYGGTQISNKDLDFARSMAGADITLNKETAERLLKIGEQAARYTLQEHRARVDNLLSGQPPKAQETLRSLYNVRDPLPGVAVGGGSPPATATPSTSSAAAASGGYKDGDTATGPGGARLIRRGGKWEPL